MSVTKRGNMPESPKAEIALTASKVAASFIPIAGGAASELLNALVTPQLEKRQKEWLESIKDGLEDLEEFFAVEIETLQQNDSFISTLLHATLIALRNHQQEKLEALRNAAINSALPNPPDDNLQMLFLNLVDTLTPYHLLLLKYYKNPYKLPERGKGEMEADRGGITKAVQYLLQEDQDLCQLFTQDLINHGLLKTNVKLLVLTANLRELPKGHVTSLGHKFLQFISAPVEK